MDAQGGRWHHPPVEGGSSNDPFATDKLRCCTHYLEPPGAIISFWDCRATRQPILQLFSSWPVVAVGVFLHRSHQDERSCASLRRRLHFQAFDRLADPWIELHRVA